MVESNYHLDKKTILKSLILKRCDCNVLLCSSCFGMSDGFLKCLLKVSEAII